MTTIGWVAIKCWSDNRGLQRMNPTDFGDPSRGTIRFRFVAFNEMVQQLFELYSLDVIVLHILSVIPAMLMTFPSDVLYV